MPPKDPVPYRDWSQPKGDDPWAAAAGKGVAKRWGNYDKGENKGGAEPAAAAESKVDGQSPSRASADKPRARPSSRGVHVGEAKGEKRPSSARQAGGLLRTALAEAERSVATMPTTGRTQTVSITGLGAKAGGREGAAPGLVFNVKQGDGQ